MHCKRCGKSLGTDRGICPFCGAMMSKDQMNVYKEMKKERMYKPELLTEKYGEKPVFYEKSKRDDSKLLALLGILFLILLLFLFLLFWVLK